MTPVLMVVQMKGHVLHLAWSGPRCSGRWQTQFRSHQHVTNVGVPFVCNWWCLTEDCHIGTVVRPDDSVYRLGRWVVQKNDDQSFLSGFSILFGCSGFDLLKSVFNCFQTISLNEEFNHLWCAEKTETEKTFRNWKKQKAVVSVLGLLDKW